MRATPLAKDREAFIPQLQEKTMELMTACAEDQAAG